MFYLQTILAPVLIISAVHFLCRPVQHHIHGVIHSAWRSLPWLYLYGIGLYLYEKKVSPGWATYSYFFFLIPISIMMTAIVLFSRGQRQKKGV